MSSKACREVTVHIYCITCNISATVRIPREKKVDHCPSCGKLPHIEKVTWVLPSPYG